MEWLGHTARHSPQPLQSSWSSKGVALPPVSSLKRMASASQASPQARQTTPFSDKQLELMLARWCQARDGAGTGACSACVLQASRQLPQKSQPVDSKVISGKPPEPRNRSCSSQAEMQSSQRVHNCMKLSSPCAHGGRIGCFWSRIRPRNNCLLLRFVFASRVSNTFPAW